MAADKQYRVVGTRPIRHDGVDKVTGEARYGADIHLPGMLHGKALRSPHAHARILRIDTSKAEAHPDVKAVITGVDLPQVADKVQDLGEMVVNLKDESNRILATGKVLYEGHPVAALAAADPHTAEEALKLIDVEYEPLQPVLDVRKAMEPDAPILNPNQRTSGIGAGDGKPSNLARHFRHERGDIERGFAEADAVIEREFITSMIHQGYIELQNGTAHITPDGRLTIWCSSQGAFSIRDQVANICNIPLSMIKVVPMEIGGGFGGKTGVYLEPLAALLAKKSRKPVKMTMTRAEVLTATGPTSGSYIKCKMGAKKDGTLTAAHVELYYEAGAFPGSPVGAASGTCLAPFKLDNVRIDGYDIVVNKPKTGAYRAPGATNAAFATEGVVSELADQIGMDPIEFRQKNAVQQGDRRADGPLFSKIGHVETLEATAESPHWNEPLEPSSDPAKKRGRGVASGFWFNGAGAATASISVFADGTVSLIEGSADIGGHRASCAMIAAEVLCLNAEDVKPQVGDTDSIGYTSVTGGSSATHKTGWATHEAALKVKAEVVNRAAKMLEVDPDEIEYHDNATLSAASKPDAKLTFAQVAARANSTGGPIVGEAGLSTGGAGNAFGTTIVDVEVDVETGKVDILRCTTVQDVGKAIHPSYVEGQMQGGAVQGIGWALSEEYVYSGEGRLLNASLLDYRMPTTLDAPLIETIMVEVANPAHPYGVRGVGEVPIVPPVAAIAEAIYNATGVRMYQAPMNPAYVLSRIQGKA